MAALLVRLVAVALLTLGPLDVVGAAENSTAATAVPLRAEQSGSLPGGPGGHFAYYSFAYPGGWPMTIELIPHTTDVAILRYAGFKVYGPSPNKEYLQSEADPTKRPNLRGSLWVTEAGVYVVQVYNYNPHTPVEYSLRREP